MTALAPRHILDAAAADLIACEHKRNGKLAYGERYCFAREHVVRADSVPELIDLALKDRQRGFTSCKRITRAIYSDEAALRAALVLARKAAA